MVCRKYAPSRRRVHEYPVNYYYAHRIDPVVTYIFDKLGFSPNGITALSLFIGSYAALFIIAEQFTLAALFIQLHHLLDGADGNLARVQEKTTQFGKWFDITVDQIVRLLILLALAYAAEVPAWLSIVMVLTFYIDIILVHTIILPCSRKRPLIRSRWKQWFLDRGLMPGFDIFTIYFIISILLLVSMPGSAVILITIMKTSDWLYRLYEVFITNRTYSLNK